MLRTNRIFFCHIFSSCHSKIQKRFKFHVLHATKSTQVDEGSGSATTTKDEYQTKSSHESTKTEHWSQKIIREVTVRQWVLFLQPRYSDLFTTRFKTAKKQNKRTKEIKLYTFFLPSLGVLTECFWWAEVFEGIRDFVASCQKNSYAKMLCCCANKTVYYCQQKLLNPKYNYWFVLFKENSFLFHFTTWFLLLVR